jgi:hypothetical protein
MRARLSFSVANCGSRRPVAPVVSHKTGGAPLISVEMVNPADAGTAHEAEEGTKM